MTTSPAFVPRRFAFFPDDAGPLGLVFAETPTGKRVTALVDGGWLRDRLTSGVFEDQSFPDHVSLPVHAPGWPERWGHGDCRLIDVVAEDLATGASWAEVRDAVTAAARLHVVDVRVPMNVR